MCVCLCLCVREREREREREGLTVFPVPLSEVPSDSESGGVREELHHELVPECLLMAVWHLQGERGGGGGGGGEKTSWNSRQEIVKVEDSVCIVERGSAAP